MPAGLMLRTAPSEKDTATETLKKRLWDAAEQAGRLCRLNLAVHDLEGDIRHGGNVNSYSNGPATRVSCRQGGPSHGLACRKPQI